MKKFLSKVLTLALVCAIVVTGTSITSEAKGKKSSKKAVATTYSSNAAINDFVATMVKSNGLVIGGKSYNTEQLLTLGITGNAAVASVPFYWQEGSTQTHSDGTVEEYTWGRSCGFYLYGNDKELNPVYDADITELEYNEMQAYGYKEFTETSTISENGVWNTPFYVANGVNSQILCAWMQSHGFATAYDVYNYLIANGATFTPASDFHSTVGDSELVCVQCPSLRVDMSADNSSLSLTYENYNLSGTNFVQLATYTEDGSGKVITGFISGTHTIKIY